MGIRRRRHHRILRARRCRQTVLFAIGLANLPGKKEHSRTTMASGLLKPFCRNQCGHAPQISDVQTIHGDSNAISKAAQSQKIPGRTTTYRVLMQSLAESKQKCASSVGQAACLSRKSPMAHCQNFTLTVSYTWQHADSACSCSLAWNANLPAKHDFEIAHVCAERNCNTGLQTSYI